MILSVMQMKMTFGEKIRLLRETQELNQATLGERVQMTQRKISYIERNEFEPSLGDIVAFCQYFQVSADYLLGLTDKKDRS